MRVFAADHDGHAYTKCFYAAVSRLSVEVVPLNYSGSRLIREVRKGDWVHLHWPSWLYYSPQRATIRNWGALVRFMGILLILRLKGARIAWSAHNLYPHNEGRILIHRIGRRFLCRVSDLVLAHGPTSATILQDEFGLPAEKIETGLLGNWIGHYPNARTAAAAREQLGLSPDDFVLLLIGSLRPYKNIEGLIRAFSQCAEPNWRLVIAGAFHSSDYRPNLLAQCASDPRVTVHDGFVPDDRLDLFLNAADRVVLPYTEILTSGAAILAMSYGRPIIAPDRGALRDHVPPLAGDLYDPARPDGLAEALRAAPGRQYSEAEILAHASALSWDLLAKTFVDRLGAA